ncbi:MAG: hypothetical protein MST10_02410 [Lentisphaeria bacterium]|nr:hypothetical protein [Lentisphaeria bacterium]
MSNPYTAAQINFNQITGKLHHAQHGCNSCPSLYAHSLVDFTPEFRKMNFYATRTHDWALWNSGQRMIDTHFVFPLLKLDPADPSNYYFKATDDIIKLAHNCGMKIFYRLGTSIEHSALEDVNAHYNTQVPPDFHHYAEVLAGIIRHYTRGWADGFQYEDMKYWEIWNEPDLGCRMWCGTQEQFIEFFVIVLKRLKSEFKDLKIGGPALCWFNMDFIKNLLNACRQANVVPDFISWHCYTGDVKFLVEQPGNMRKELDNLGFKNTELCINEWHYIVSWDGVQASASTDMRLRAMSGPCGLHGIDSGCFNLAVLTGWQDQPLDSGFYYGAALDGSWGFRDEFRKENKNSYSMKMFGRLLAEAEDRVATSPSNAETLQENKNVFILGAWAKDGKSAKLLVTDYRGEDSTIELDIVGLENTRYISAVILDQQHDLVPVPVIWHNNHLTLTKNGYGSAAFYISFEL